MYADVHSRVREIGGRPVAEIAKTIIDDKAAGLVARIAAAPPEADITADLYDLCVLNRMRDSHAEERT